MTTLLRYTRISVSLDSMALTLGAIILNVPETGPAAEFWQQALGFTADPGNPDFLAPPGADFVVLKAPDGTVFCVIS